MEYYSAITSEILLMSYHLAILIRHILHQNGFDGHHVEGHKLDTERQNAYVLPYMWGLKFFEYQRRKFLCITVLPQYVFCLTLLGKFFFQKT